MMGTDLLSKEHNDTVPFRNGDWVTPKYTKYNGDYYYSKSGKQIKKLSASQKKQTDKIQKWVTTDLGLSDKVMNGDLLRFYKLPGFKKVDKKSYSYNLQKALKKLKTDKKRKNSVRAQNGNKSTVNDYSTDAPELENSSSQKFPK